MGEFLPEDGFARSPVARLATASPDGTPHLVPVVFAVGGGPGGGLTGATVYTAVDGKPKSTRRLRRLDNIDGNPRVCLLVDHYCDDWTRLWWVRVDGTAVVHRDDHAAATGYRLLRAKYTQYQSIPLDGPVIAIAVQHWSSWHA